MSCGSYFPRFGVLKVLKSQGAMFYGQLSPITEVAKVHTFFTQVKKKHQKGKSSGSEMLSMKVKSCPLKDISIGCFWSAN